MQRKSLASVKQARWTGKCPKSLKYTSARLKQDAEILVMLWLTEDGQPCLLSDVALCFYARWGPAEMNRIRESLVLWLQRGDGDALQTKMSSPLCLFLLNAFPLLLQATATDVLMCGYRNTVSCCNEIFTFGPSCTEKNVLILRQPWSENVIFVLWAWRLSEGEVYN